MDKNFCYIPTELDRELSRNDITLADEIDINEDGLKMPSQNSNGLYVATLRGLYDADTETDKVDWENISIDEAQRILGEFRQKLHTKQANRIRSNSENLSSSFYKLRNSIDGSIRENRVNFISDIFSQIVTKYIEANPGYTRNAVCNGIRLSDGTIALGETAIFDEVFKEICINMQACEAAGKTYIANELAKVLDNWGALVTLARIKLRDTEGLILGGAASYSAEATNENFEENLISDMFDPEEAIRDGWQEVSEAISAYSTIGKNVRRVISKLPMFDSAGKVVPDDLGRPTYMNPVKVYNALVDIVKGNTGSQDMLHRLETARNSGQTWITPILEAITPSVVDLNGQTITCKTPEDYGNAKNLLRSQMYEYGYSSEEITEELSRVDAENSEKWQNLTMFNNDLGKTFCLLSTMATKFRKGVMVYITDIINKVSHYNTKDSAITNMRAGNVVSEISLFDKNGNVNWKGVEDLEDVINKGFTGTFATIATGTFNEKKSLLIKVANSLGFKLSQYAVSSILHNGQQKQDFIDAVTQLKEYWINSSSLKARKGSVTSMKDALSYKSGNSESDNGVLEEVVYKISKLIARNDENLQYENRVPYVDKKGKPTTLSSIINPSFLSDRMDAFKTLIDRGSQKDLREYIEKTYFDCPIYADKILDVNGKVTGYNIHNLWLKELYNSPVITDESGKTRFAPTSFARQFMYERFLGDSKENGGKRFEDYTEKGHALSMLAQFMAPREHSKDASFFGNFSVFIQGDSGVSKFIRARIYSEDQVLDSLYEVYKQELIRMQLAYESNELLKVENQIPIQNFSDNANKFTALPFLNKSFDAAWVKEKNDKGEEKIILKVYKKGTTVLADTTDIKNAIENEMEESYKRFHRKLHRLGLFKINEDTGDYEYLNNFEKPKSGHIALTDKHKNQLHAQLRSYFFNTKLNTINQMQVMSVDVGFYEGSKDLQKRYKEIHAPGNRIDPTAYDIWNNKPVSDGWETAVYIDDISTDAAETDPDFMEVMKNVFGDYEDIIDKYGNNSLTDGQGWRTLDSYRKVMIMKGATEEGGWTEKQENAYRTIKELQGKEELTEEDINKINECAVCFQPIKSFMYTFENLPVGKKGEVLKIPVQHKYAEIVLIPEILPKGSKLRALATAMQDNNIDLACSTKVVKVGNFGATALDYKINDKGLYVDSNGNVIPVEGGKELTRQNQKKNPNFKNLAVPIEDIDIAAQFNSGYVHKLSYYDYRIQNNVPEHVNHAALFGTQARKIGTSGLNMASDHYKNYVLDENGEPAKVNLGPSIGSHTLNGRRLLWFYNQLISANIIEGVNNFIKSVSNDEDVSKQLIQNIISNSREYQDNILAYSLTKDGKFLIPLFEASLSHDSSATLLSVIKKMINKQQIAGGAAVQASAWGLKKMQGADDGDLKYHVSADKSNILWAECEMPFNFKYTDNTGKEVQLDYNKYCNPNGEFKLTGRKILKYGEEIDETLIERDFPGILDIIAYRIPTESHYSMMNLRVKRCTLPIAGGTIKVPSPAVTQAGFDFDIDKLYLMRKELKERDLTREEFGKVIRDFYRANPNIKKALYKAETSEAAIPDKQSLASYWEKAGLPGTFKDAISKFFQDNIHKYRKFVEYDPSKPVSTLTDNEGNVIKGNNRIARNNMLINILQHRLADKETLKGRFTPGGFENPKKAARMMRELVFTDPKKLLGASSPNNPSGIISKVEERVNDKTIKDPEPDYDYSDPTTLLVYNQQNQVAGKLIGIFANQNVNHMLASLMESYTCTPVGFGDHVNYPLSDLLHNTAAVSTTAEFLAASVDAVKDPVLNFLNLNTVTANIGAVLARLGYSTFEIGLLFNQPAVKYICDVSFNNGLSIDDAINKAKEKYKVSKTIDVSDKNAIFGSERLAWNIIVSREGSDNPVVEGEEFQTYQGKIIELFSQLSKITSEVNNFVSSTRWTASNAVSSRMGDMYAQIYKVRRYIKDQISKETTATSMMIAPNFRVMMDDRNEDFQNQGIAIGMGSLTINDFEYMQKIAENPFAYEQCMFDSLRKAVKVLSDKFYPYETPLYNDMRNLLDTVSTYGINGDIIEQAHQDLMTYVLSKMPGSRFSSTSKIKRGRYFGDPNETSVSSEYYFKEVFAEKLFKLKKDGSNLFDNPLFSAISFELGKDKLNWDGTAKPTIKLKIKGVAMQANQIDVIREAWENLLLSDDPVVKEIAEDLYFYNFFNNGFDVNPVSFTNAVPSILRANVVIGTSNDGTPILYRDILNLIQQGKVFPATIKSAVIDFVKQFICNNFDNRRLVYRFTDSSAGIEFAKNKAAQNKGEGFKVHPSETQYINQNPFIVETKTDPSTGKPMYKFRAAVIINNTLYIADSGRYAFNTVVDNTEIIYRKANMNLNNTYNSTIKAQEDIDINAIGISETGSVVGESTGSIVYEPNTMSVEEAAIVESMSDDLRALFELQSEDKKQEILEGKKNQKCYNIVNGVIKEELC